MSALALAPLHYAFLHQPVEAYRENIPGNIQAALELAETFRPEEGVAQDQQGPTFTDHLQGLGQ